MSSLISYGKEVNSIFQLLGDKENDITLSISWALRKCPELTRLIVKNIFKIDITNIDEVTVSNQQYDNLTGITDIELKDNNNFHIIFEAKRGWILPGADQLTRYSLRNDFVNNPVKHKAIVTMSECSKEYADFNLPFKEVNNIPIIHLSWKDIFQMAVESRPNSNNEQKHLLAELQEYLRGIMTMQNKESNMVYVVSLGSTKPEGCNITWIDIVKQHNKYFCPVGGNGWPKEPPNYIAFRYYGKLQSIHHIDSYVITKNLSDEVNNMPDKELEINHFVYKLGPAIMPTKTVKTGKIFQSGRVWAMLDTLLTCDTISEARDLTKERRE